MKTILFWAGALLSCLWAATPALAADALDTQAGFYSIEPITYSLQDPRHGATSFTTTRTNLFYSYHPAAGGQAASRPLLVMLNGGPGAGTATNLLSMNTAPYTLDREQQVDGSPGYSPNPNSWTAVGNLLYIDAPATGFSYLLSDHITNEPERTAEFFLSGNFNPFIDAAQVVRVVLRFLGDHPKIKANQVILVGESYGGTRVTTMLHLLLYHASYAAGGSLVYQDPALVREIDDHFRSIYGESIGVGPQTVARQFGRQILIQPELAGVYQDEIAGRMFYGEAPWHDQIIYNLAKETGTTFPSTVIPIKFWNASKATKVLMYYVPSKFKRDRYNCAKTATWSDDLEAYAAHSLRRYRALSTILGYDVDQIAGMLPQERHKAFKLIVGMKIEGMGWTFNPDEVTDAEWYLQPDNQEYLPPNPDTALRLEALAHSEGYLDNFVYTDAGGDQWLWDRLGKLYRWDGYLVEMNIPVYLAYTQGISSDSRYPINPDEAVVYGQMFLENLPLIKTFLTDAAYDLVIYSPAIPEALKMYPKYVKSITYQRGKDASGGRLGSFVVYYQPGCLDQVTTPEKVELHYPYYATSGHSVSSAQPGQFLSDVSAWLGQ